MPRLGDTPRTRPALRPRNLNPYNPTMTREEDIHPEGPSPDDMERFGDEWRTCPSCSKQVYDEAEICPHCGEALSTEPVRMPLWAIAVVMAVIAVFLLAAIL
jgi:uncharacterized paraquat-inducible protein A